MTANAAPPSAALPGAKAGGQTSKVIVMLRDYESGLAQRSVLRTSAVSSEESSLVSQLRTAGAHIDAVGKSIPYLVASVTAAQRVALQGNPEVIKVAPDVVIPNPSVPVFASSDPVVKTAVAKSHTGAVSRSASAPSICGTATSPEVDPEAITSAAINSVGANALGYDGAGVTVAYIAGNIDTTQPDFQRSATYASSGSAPGTPVVNNVNFSGDPSTVTDGGDVEGESFLDASSIAAQGNTIYNLNQYVNSSHTLPSTPCDITITGAAPGASVIGLDVFSQDYNTTESNFIQAIDYAVHNGVKVLNESFGSNNFPDTALDITRIADDDAVAAGVTVVVSSGDAGVGNTIGSPATDPHLISVGATTTFRSYEQNFYGGINATIPKANNGTWVDNNVSAISSAGFSQQGGNTVDLVAPGDLNWMLCSPEDSICTTENGTPSYISQSGGTSESSPLTAGAAADVIQAYASTHGGKDPSPALVKQILMSTAKDISSPAEEQGAGLLNVLAAVKEAASIKGTSGTPSGGLLVSPNQVNIVQAPKASTTKTISLTNTGSATEKVKLSTRALTHEVSKVTGHFCLNPTSSASGQCGAPTASTFAIWSGVTEVYQEESFSVPTTKTPSRLEFSADYQYTGQTSLLHVALLSPSGAYAGYSLPQGLADYAHIEVANPAAGKWTAVFFTAQTAGSNVGTSGNVQWAATTSEFESAGKLSVGSLTIPKGATKTFRFTATSSSVSGDAAQSIVLSTVGGAVNTIPVTVRTTIPMTSKGATFSGVLTGGNGRQNPAEMESYVFNVPKGEKDLDVSVKFADKNDVLTALLLDPYGNAVASSSNVSLPSTLKGAPITLGGVSTYKDSPVAGQWTLVLDWDEPVSGSELSLPFSGAIRFNQVKVSSSLPDSSSVKLTPGKSYTYHVKVTNTGVTPEVVFLDPRGTGTETVKLADLAGSDQNMSLPLVGSFPLYAMPTDTTGISAKLTGSVPVNFDTEPYSGDPDLSPSVKAPGVTGSVSGDTAKVAWTTKDEVMPGIWYLNPSEVGPYGPTGEPSATASASLTATTRKFDFSITSKTGDLWTAENGLSNRFAPIYIEPGKSATIAVTVKATGSKGETFGGVVAVDNTFVYDPLVGEFTGADETAALPFSYKIS